MLAELKKCIIELVFKMYYYKHIFYCAELIAPSLLRRAYCAELIAPSLLRRAYCAELIAPSRGAGYFVVQTR